MSEGEMRPIPRSHYRHYLGSALWETKRWQRFILDEFRCQGCGSDEWPLECHHLTYERLGLEEMDDLRSLCRRCHQAVSENPGLAIEEIGQFLAEMDAAHEARPDHLSLFCAELMATHPEWRPLIDARFALLGEPPIETAAALPGDPEEVPELTESVLADFLRLRMREVIYGLRAIAEGQERGEHQLAQVKELTERKRRIDAALVDLDTRRPLRVRQ